MEYIDSILALVQESKRILNREDVSEKMIHHAIFNSIKPRVETLLGTTIEWCDPDTTYYAAASAYVSALEEYVQSKE